jgi:ABC-type nitrate/sulfonate/bicarbonate transport system ATPase subunit
MSDLLLAARGIRKSFDKDGVRLDVLRGIDLDICEGDVITIMGPSGAGKSTFLHILGSLDTPPRARSSTAATLPASGNRAGQLQESEDWIRVSVLSPPAGFYRAREHHGPALDQRCEAA